MYLVKIIVIAVMMVMVMNMKVVMLMISLTRTQARMPVSRKTERNQSGIGNRKSSSV